MPAITTLPHIPTHLPNHQLASHWQAIEDLAARVGALVEKEREMVAARDYSAAGICVQEIKDAEAELKQKVTEAEALLG